MMKCLTSVSELNRGKTITDLNIQVGSTSSDCHLRTRGFLRAKKSKVATKKTRRKKV